MIKSPNYIHFRIQWQLMGPNSPGLRFERQVFQDFWNDLRTDPLASDYDDFSYRPDRFELGKLRGDQPRGGQAFSKILYENDLLTVVDEWADVSADEFAQKFTRILSTWFKHFPQTLAVIQRCWLRALMEPRHFEDSRQFLGDRVLGLGGKLQASLHRMPHQVGFTFGCTRDVMNSSLLLDAKVNSWRESRSVWTEVAGVVPLRAPMNATNVETAQVPFAACKDFLEGEVIGLLTKFDEQPSDGEQGSLK